MTVGEHTVTIYADPGAGGWSTPLAPNPYLTANLDGWTQSPFSPVWVWNADGSASGSVGITRSQAFPVARTPATTYRLRTTITLATRANFKWGLNYGTTPYGAEVGPFWQPSLAVDQSAWNVFEPGTYTIESTFDPSGIPAGYVYLGPYAATWGDSPPPFTISTIELTARTAAPVDLSCLVDEVSIAHGRDDSTTQPEASSATVTLSTNGDPLPALVDVGASLVITTTAASGTRERFVGRVTDVSLGWDEAGTETPDAGVGQIVAVGPLADLGRRIVGDTPWPQELDGARVSRIVGLAGSTLDPLYSDPGTVAILARDVDSQPALDLAREVAETATGVLWETRGGEIRYADSSHRRGTPSTLTLDACDVLVTPSWRRTTEGLVNSVSIGYGPAPVGGGEQPRYVASNPTSVTRWGTYAYTAETALAALADATAMGQLLLARNSSPVWVMAALPVDVAGLDDDRTAALLDLDLHSLVTLTGLPSLGIAPTSAVLWVEGYAERLAAGVHEIELVVSGYCRTSPPPRWDDVSPEWAWDEVAPDLTWDDAACLGPPSNLGRWNDQPATLRWDLVAPAVSWDTYA